MLNNRWTSTVDQYSWTYSKLGRIKESVDQYTEVLSPKTCWTTTAGYSGTRMAH